MMKFLDLIPNICEGFPFREGESVLLNFWGDQAEREVLDLLAENLAKKGIAPYEHHCSHAFFERVVLNLIHHDKKFPQEYLDYLSSFKHVIDIFMYRPSLPKGIHESEIPLFQSYLSELFGALTDDKEHYIQLTVPTQVNSLHTGMDPQTYELALCNALSVNFPELKKACREKLESVEHKETITIHTGQEYALTLDISTRQWFVDDGCGDFPPGEIYIAPKENKSHGDLLIPIVNLQGQIYEDVLMTFKEGKLIGSSCQELDDFFLQRPDSFRILSEFGIGLNPEVKELTGYTPIDEKALGTYHIALGMNHLFGGDNDCLFHMDFVFYADDVVFS